jgi:hypothetical protein
MRVLLTNNTLKHHAGSEMYIRDLAATLVRRGHSPVAYSQELGPVAEELRAASVPVIDDLNELTVPPDVIHGHHHLEIMAALLRFRGVPAIFVCHGWVPWEESPPLHPRIRHLRGGERAPGRSPHFERHTFRAGGGAPQRSRPVPVPAASRRAPPVPATRAGLRQLRQRGLLSSPGESRVRAPWWSATGRPWPAW